MNILLKNDGASSIDIGLELAGVDGLVRRAGSIYNLHRKGGFGTFESIRQACTTCNLHRKDGPTGGGGVCRPPL